MTPFGPSEPRPYHDPRIDLLRSRRLRTILTAFERHLNALITDPELVPLTLASIFALVLWIAARDPIWILTHTADHLSLWFPFLFLLGVQFGRLYYRRKR